MEKIFVLIVVGAIILSFVGYLIWWIILFFIAKKVVNAASANFNQTFNSIEHILRACQQSYDNLSDSEKAQLINQLNQVGSQFKQMDTLSQQRYDTRIADLQGMAASAGIDWTPGSY